MQQSGVPGSRGCALCSLLGVLFFQGEWAGGGLNLHFRPGAQGRWSLFRFRWGVSGKPPLSFWEGRKEAGGSGEDILIITTHWAELVASRCFLKPLRARPPCVTLVLGRWRDLMETRRALTLGAPGIISWWVINDWLGCGFVGLISCLGENSSSLQ